MQQKNNKESTGIKYSNKKNKKAKEEVRKRETSDCTM